MTGNKAYLAEYQDYNGGLVAFGGSKGYIIGKGKIKTGKLDFEDVCFVKELQHFNLFSVSQMCDKKNKVLFIDTECLMLSSDFKLPDENQSVISENQANKTAGPKEANHSASTQDNIDARNSEMEVESAEDYFVLPIWSSYNSTANDAAKALRKEFSQDTKDLVLQAGAARATSTNTVNTASTPVSTASPSVTDFTNLETIVNLSLIPTSRIHSIHPSTQILGDLKSAVQIRSKVNKSSGAHTFISEALEVKVGLMLCRKNCCNLRFRKFGFLQEEAIDYDEVFAPVAMIEVIKIFLAFASYMGFIVYHMDVKSVFLYGIIDEEVYVSQPLGFVDPKFPKKVYKVVKALYGLHQAPRAWYSTLSTFLLKSRYRRGTIDKTLLIKKDKNDIMLVQVYVDDIIFGSTKRSWCNEFKALMKSRFQMSLWEELNLLFRLQVKQKTDDGIFISQDKYVAEILKKFDFTYVKTASFPIETQKPLTKDEEADDVDIHLYRSMIGSLMYLTASRPDIMYLKGKPKLGLWYLIVSSFDLESYSDSDYAGANLDRKSTTGGCQFLGRRLILWQCKKQTIVATSTTEAEMVLLLGLGKKMIFGLFGNTATSINSPNCVEAKYMPLVMDRLSSNIRIISKECLESTQNNSLAKLPLLKQGEYDTWRLRIESYIQLQDYAFSEIIEEGNSFKPVARTTTNEVGTYTTAILGDVTAEQKILKKNDLKARSILMMTLPSEHLLTFNKHKDAKSLFEAI
ncbi:putative ribonuclease H-like domain-containing protein [Tanacetum coccineum]